MTDFANTYLLIGLLIGFVMVLAVMACGSKKDKDD